MFYVELVISIPRQIRTRADWNESFFPKHLKEDAIVNVYVVVIKIEKATIGAERGCFHIVRSQGLIAREIVELHGFVSRNYRILMFSCP